MSFLVFQYIIKSMREPDVVLTLASTCIILAAQSFLNQTAPEPEPENRASLLNRGMFRQTTNNSSSDPQENYTSRPR